MVGPDRSEEFHYTFAQLAHNRLASRLDLTMHIESDVNPHGSTFKAHREAMISLVDEVRELEQRVIRSSEKKREKFEGRGQLLPRDRVALLLDRGRPVIELCSLAGLGMHDDDGEHRIQGGNSYMAIGWVSGVRVMVYAHNSAIKGGAISPMGVKKALRAQEIALENRLPMVTLAESAGANYAEVGAAIKAAGKGGAYVVRVDAHSLSLLSASLPALSSSSKRLAASYCSSRDDAR